MHHNLLISKSITLKSIQSTNWPWNMRCFMFLSIGWYIVWVAFLSRFKLMRELLSIGESDKEKETVQPASKSSVRSRRGKQSKAFDRWYNMCSSGSSTVHCITMSQFCITNQYWSIAAQSMELSHELIVSTVEPIWPSFIWSINYCKWFACLLHKRQNISITVVCLLGYHLLLWSFCLSGKFGHKFAKIQHWKWVENVKRYKSEIFNM